MRCGDAWDIPGFPGLSGGVLFCEEREGPAFLPRKAGRGILFTERGEMSMQEIQEQMPAGGPGTGKRFGLNGNRLKQIALITMLIDHTGYLLVSSWTVSFPRASQAYLYLYYLYFIMRTIGRIAFPIYAFMVVEGFYHTRNWRKYARNMAVLFLVSEIPFDLVTSGTWFALSYQNIYVTLLLGLLMMKTIETAKKKVPERVYLPVTFGIAAAFSLAAWLFKSDYYYGGVILIFLLYWFREDRRKACLLGGIWMFFYECMDFIPMGIGVAASFLLLYFYDGTRRPSRWKYGKYGYYAFYPIHLALLYILYRLIFV